MNAEQVAYAVTKRVQGVPVRTIGDDLGVSHTTVVRALNKAEIKAKIEREAEQIISRGLKVARRTITRLAAEGNKGKDPAMLKLALDASKHITSMAGLSGNAPSTIINQMIQINNAPEESKEVADIKSFIQSKMLMSQSETNETEIIDVAPSHTSVDCADIAHFDDKQVPCQDVEVEGIPGEGEEDPQE